MALKVNNSHGGKKVIQYGFKFKTKPFLLHIRIAIFAIGCSFVHACAKPSEGKRPASESTKSSSGDARSAKNKVAPVEATLESVTSTVDGRNPSDFRLLSNIYSLALGVDPYLNHLEPSVKKVLKTWTYSRDPEKKIVLSIDLTSTQQTFVGTEKNLWWSSENVHKVVEYTGVWALDDVFIKLARNAAGEQWNFNYKITKVKEVP